MSQSSREFLTPQQLAERWSISPWTLTNWRSAGIGPQFFKPSYRIVLYPIDAILSYESANTVTPLTADEVFSR